MSSLRKFFLLPFFSHVDMRRYDLMRICFGIASLCNIIDMWDIRHSIFSDQGIISHYPKRYFSITNYSLFYLDGAQSLFGVNLIFLISAFFCVLLTLGIFSRISAFAVCLWTISYVNHIPPVACGYEMILQIFSLIVLISPLNGSWSLAGYRKYAHNYCPMAPRYGLVLLQWQVFVIYWTTAFHKIINNNWQNGETVYFYLASYYGRFTPEEIWKYNELLFFLSDATLAIEFALPFLLWNKKTRLLGLFLGIGFHASIGALSRLSIFSIAIVSTYSCYIEISDLKRIRFWKK